MSQSAQTAAANGSTKMMMWMMPLMSIYIAFIVPAALGVYWAAQSASPLSRRWSWASSTPRSCRKSEDARQEMIQADRQKRMEEAKLLQEQQRQQAAQKKSLKEKRQAAQGGQGPEGQKAATSTTEAGRGDRPYARAGPTRRTAMMISKELVTP